MVHQCQYSHWFPKAIACPLPYVDCIYWKCHGTRKRKGKYPRKKEEIGGESVKPGEMDSSYKEGDFN